MKTVGSVGPVHVPLTPTWDVVELPCVDGEAIHLPVSVDALEVTEVRQRCWSGGRCGTSADMTGWLDSLTD